MAEHSLKLNIADRVYPIKVEEGEEENLYKAARIINEKIKVFQDKFAVKDKQDLLSMAALDFVIENITNNDQKDNHQSNLIGKLDELDIQLSTCLSSD